MYLLVSALNSYTRGVTAPLQYITYNVTAAVTTAKQPENENVIHTAKYADGFHRIFLFATVFVAHFNYLD